MTYSLRKGIIKGLISLLSIGGAFLALTAFSDMTLWGLLETYLKPILGSLTVGGLVTMCLNWLKIRGKMRRMRKDQ